MIRFRPYPFFVLTAAVALLSGCATDAARDSTKYSLESTEKFVTLDRVTQAEVACTGLRERVLPDGRLEVVVNVKNRSANPLKLQINCVFKSDQGFSIGDETPFQPLRLAANATETVRFTATNPQAKRYTIRVKQAR